MEMHIKRMSAKVTATSADTVLHPQVMDRIVTAAVERINKTRTAERRAEEDCRIRPSVSGDPESGDWS